MSEPTESRRHTRDRAALIAAIARGDLTCEIDTCNDLYEIDPEELKIIFSILDDFVVRKVELKKIETFQPRLSPEQKNFIACGNALKRLADKKRIDLITDIFAEVFQETIPDLSSVQLRRALDIVWREIKKSKNQYNPKQKKLLIDTLQILQKRIKEI